MTRLRLFSAALAVLLVGRSAFAQEVAPPTRVLVYDNALAAVALNGAVGTRTITKNMYTGRAVRAEFAKARLALFYTYGAATAVTVVFSCSRDGTNYAQVTSRNISGATATISKLTDSYTTGAANADIDLEYDVRGCVSAKWVVAGTGANGSDVVTADLSVIAGE